MSAPAAPLPSVAPAPITNEICLLAPGHLSALLRFRESLPGDPGIDPEGLADAWRAAAKVYQRLEVDEAGAADHPDIGRMPAELDDHVGRLIDSAAVQHTFDTVPVSFGMVPLDKLIISQFSVADAIVSDLGRLDATALTPAALAELCLPLQTRAPDLRLVYQNPREWVFVSDAHDMRLLGTRIIDPRKVSGLDARGHVQSIAGLCVGFSVNLVNAILFRDRLVLNNGHHRVHALRQRGVTHVPCLMQVCGTKDEMYEASSDNIRSHADLYFDSPRPPLLRDFDNPALVRRLRSPARRRELRLKVTVESHLVAK